MHNKPDLSQDGCDACARLPYWTGLYVRKPRGLDPICADLRSNCFFSHDASTFPFSLVAKLGSAAGKPWTA